MKNSLILNRFAIAIPNHKLLEMSAIRATLPTVSTSPAELQVPKLALHPHIADTITYSTLTVSFAVDENCEVYNDVLMWAESLVAGKENREDITLSPLDSNRKPSASYVFEDAFPRDIDGMTFDLESDNMRAIIDVTFAFLRMRVK